MLSMDFFIDSVCRCEKSIWVVLQVRPICASREKDSPSLSQQLAEKEKDEE